MSRSVAKSSLSPLSLPLWWVAWRYCPPDTIVLFVSRTRNLRIHTAGVCVTSRSVAKGSPSPQGLPLWWVARRYCPPDTIVSPGKQTKNYL